MNRENFFEYSKVLGVIHNELVTADFEDRRFLAIDIVIEAFDHFLHLLAIVARVVEDGFERGVLFDLLEDRVLFALKKLHIIGLFLEAVLQGVADRNVVMNEGDDGFGVLIHLFLLSRGPYLSADGYR